MLQLLPDHYREQVGDITERARTDKDAFGELRNHTGSRSNRHRIVQAYIASLGDREKKILLLHFIDLSETEKSAARERLAGEYNLTVRGVKGIATRELGKFYSAHPGIAPRGYKSRVDHRTQAGTAAYGNAAVLDSQPPSMSVPLIEAPERQDAPVVEEPQDHTAEQEIGSPADAPTEAQQVKAPPPTSSTFAAVIPASPGTRNPKSSLRSLVSRLARPFRRFQPKTPGRSHR